MIIESGGGKPGAIQCTFDERFFRREKNIPGIEIGLQKGEVALGNDSLELLQQFRGSDFLPGSAELITQHPEGIPQFV